MKLKNYLIDTVDTGIFFLDGGAMFGVVPKVMWSKAYNQGDEKNRIPLAARPLLIRGEGKNILVDTGNGINYSEKILSIYGIDREKSNIANSLKPFDLKPEDISDVILTHLHFDHCGASTIIRNGEFEPAFVNAKYYIQKEHLKWAKNPNMKDSASFIPENFIPIDSDGLFEQLDGEGEVFPGISVIPVNGHTPSMQMVKISDGSDTILYCADLAPTSAHLRYTFGLAYDNLPLTTIEEKIKYLPQAYEEKWTIVFEHDAFIQAGKLKSGDKGFELDEAIKITV